MGDAVALADALEALILDPKKASALGQQAHRRVRGKFTAIQSARAIESIYEQMLA